MTPFKWFWSIVGLAIASLLVILGIAFKNTTAVNTGIGVAIGSAIATYWESKR